jgi:hypothetical protein
MTRLSYLSLSVLLSFLALPVLLAACGDDGGADSGALDTGAPPPTDSGTGGDASTDTGAATDASGDTGGTMMLTESEPNGGTTETEVNDLPVGAVMSGAIGEAGDSDIFLVPTVAGRAYRVTLEPAGPLMGHLTIIDSGRDGDPAGDDYVHLSRTGSGGAVELDLLAMGAGHLVAVRDLRSLGGGAGSGGADHTYTLRVTELDLGAIAEGLTLPSTVMGSLTHPGAMAVYTFSGTEGTWVTFDLTPSGEMDARLFIVAESTGSWIARNDDRGPADDTPLIDAPLTAGGTMYLVVENIDEQAAGLGFSITASME